MALSAEAWANLQTISRDMGFNSVSQFVENIGLRKLTIALPTDVLVENNKIEDLSIRWKIKFLLMPPSAVFTSLVHFVARTAKQLHLDERELLDDLVADVLQKAITVVFFVGYLCPERYFNNPSAYIRAISYQILLARHSNSNLSDCLTLRSSEVNECVTRIRQMLYFMETARSKNYAVFKMKVIDNLTWSQIRAILALQGEETTEQELRLRVKMAYAQLRSDWNKPLKSSLRSWDDPSKLKPGEAEARQYLSILSTEDSGDLPWWSKLEKFLFESKDDVAIDFWINEIDYYLGSVQQQTISSDRCEQIRQKVDNDIDAYLEKRITDIDQIFRACANRDDIHSLLKQVLIEEGSPNVKPSTLLEQVTEVKDMSQLKQKLEERFTKNVSNKIDRFFDVFKPAVKITNEVNYARDRGEISEEEALNMIKAELEKMYKKDPSDPPINSEIVGHCDDSDPMDMLKCIVIETIHEPGNFD